MAECPFDVVVTDMRMPGMDGEQLLKTVRDRFPGTVQIALSGESEQQGLVRATGPAHHYLSKPCDGEELKQAVTRACPPDSPAAQGRRGLTQTVESMTAGRAGGLRK